MNELAQWLKDHPFDGTFQPRASYCPDGDTIHCYFKDDACYYEALGNMDIARSQETGEIVGVSISNVRKLLKT